MEDVDFSFRPLREGDLDLMHHWLNRPFVRQWYGPGQLRSYDEIEARYLPRIRGEQPTRGYVMSADDVPFGYVQTYHVADYPDYWRALALEGDVFGVDLFVGEKDYLHRGYGSAALRRFVREVVFGQLDAELCVVGPVPENAAAIRAYEKAGFRYLKTISTGHEREERLMVAYPEDVTHNEE